MPQEAWHDATLCPICHRESCENPAHRARGERDQTPPPVFQTAGELLTEASPLDIVEGVAQAGRLTALVSESGAGKTFVLLVLHGSVAYISYEGDALGLRMRAIRDHQGHRLEHLYILRASEPISPQVSHHDGEVRSLGELLVHAAIKSLVDHLAAAGKPPIRLVVIDTVRASMIGSEDSSEPVAAYLRVARRLLAEVPDAGGILAHHAGWQDGETQKKRERGSSAWRGNCDITLYLEAEEADRVRGEAGITLRVLKIRDGERPADLALIRRQVELSERTRKGDLVTSCIVDTDRRTPADKEAATVARVDRAERPNDLKILRAMADHPDLATSQERLRLLLGIRRNTINDACARLLRKDWIRLPVKQRQPYAVTEAGQEALKSV